MFFYFVMVYLVAVGVFSAICFVMYGWDKRQASGGGQRVSEKNLHTFAVLGGWPGAIAGQKVFRHKTQKTSFRIVFYLTVLLHVIISIVVFYFCWGYLK